MPVVIGGDNLPSPVGIVLTDLPNIGGASGTPGPPVPASLLNLLCTLYYLSRPKIPNQTTNLFFKEFIGAVYSTDSYIFLMRLIIS